MLRTQAPDQQEKLGKITERKKLELRFSMDLITE